MDAVFHTVDQFNCHANKVTARWDMKNNQRSPKNTASLGYPGLYTIVKHFPNVLFSLNPTTDYTERQADCTVCRLSFIHFMV